ncbi:MAG: sigma-70 family RNA polymerase sigma factor [Acidobacteria bacterium]|nr:sigma-70 family RNA polymerase sigma factor [Acidobacteriota bacterium]
MPNEQSTLPVTTLLARWRAGESKALDELSPIVYQELRRIARSLLSRERGGHTLQPTALTHEAFLRLCGDVPDIDWRSRAHFLGIAARIMRQVLIQHARARSAAKRGAAPITICLGNAESHLGAGPATGLHELDQALTHLTSFDVRKATVVEMRYFGGLTVPEIAEALGISEPTVERDMRTALAWLRRELKA